MRWPNHKILPLLFILLSISVPLCSQAADSQSVWVKRVVDEDTFIGKVVGVSGGDTISVMRGGRAVKVHLHGIDCPEKGQAFGTRAKRFTLEMAFGNEVTVQVKTTDRHGRIVGEVFLPDGLSLNKQLVYLGLAWWYRNYAPNDRTLKALEAGARDAKRGLWAEKDPIPPWEWREGQRTRRTEK